MHAHVNGFGRGGSSLCIVWLRFSVGIVEIVEIVEIVGIAVASGDDGRVTRAGRYHLRRSLAIRAHARDALVGFWRGVILFPLLSPFIFLLSFLLVFFLSPHVISYRVETLYKCRGRGQQDPVILFPLI